MTAPTTTQPLRRASDDHFRQPMSEWFTEFELWGKRVKRDIIKLEEFLESKHSEFKPGKPPKGGDPGDPPRGPW